MKITKEQLTEIILDSLKEVLSEARWKALTDEITVKINALLLSYKDDVLPDKEIKKFCDENSVTHDDFMQYIYHLASAYLMKW